MTAKKNNELPTDVGEAKTDIVLENNDSQVPEDVSSNIGVCETGMVKETPSPGYEEFGEPPKTETGQQVEDEKAPKNQKEVESIIETDSVKDEEMATQVTEGKEDISMHNTEIETPKETVRHGREFSENSQVLETDREIKEWNFSGVTDSKENTKTDSEISEKALNARENSGEESETVKPKKRRKLLKIEMSESVVDEKVAQKTKKTSKVEDPDNEIVDKASSEERVVKIEEKKKSTKRTQTAKPIMTIDNERTVETDEDRAKNDLIDLLESFKSGKVLSGIIQGVETTENDEQPLAVIYHGDYKIIIPTFELIDEPEDYNGFRPKDVHLYLLRRRLGAEIDYVVKGVDKKMGLAVASRKEAMKAKRKSYYFGKDRDGNYLLYDGVFAEARVVSVIRTGIFVEIFGIETFISVRELRYLRVMDAKLYYQVGQRVIVKVLEIDRTDKNNIKIKASIKQASANPYTTAMRKYTVGNCYVGMVSLVQEVGVFVALDDGIECLCAFPKRGRPPRGARVTVRILGVNPESNRIWGVIMHMAMPR